MPDLTGLGSVFDFGTELVKRLWPDANETERAKQTQLLAELEIFHKERVAQIEVNKAQATNPNILVSGGRPALMWVCVAAFAINYLIYPLWSWMATFRGWPVPAAPPLDAGLWELTFGMLGLAGLRSWEKGKGVARP